MLDLCRLDGHGQDAATALAGLEDFPAQPGSRDCLHRSIRSQNHLLKLLYGLVVLRHARRRVARIAVTTNPTAGWIAGQLTEAFPWSEAPRHLIRDRDRAFGSAYTRRVHAMGIRDHPTAARSPRPNGHVVRLIGSLRRECLDNVLVFGEADLRRVLKSTGRLRNLGGAKAYVWRADDEG